MNIIHGDCLEELKKLEYNSVDAVITDPPYGLSNTKPAQVADVLKAWVTGDAEAAPTTKGGFMNASWDSFVPPPAVWEECMRVLKPGGHMAVFAGARTQDLMGLSIRLAGFEIRDTLGWIYGSGFPKSHDIGKAIDKYNGNPLAFREFAAAYREAVAKSGLTHSAIDKALGIKASSCYWARDDHRGGMPPRHHWEKVRDLVYIPEELEGLYDEAEREVVGVQKGAMSGWNMDGTTKFVDRNITTPATSEAQRWDGWGTALKPAIEPIILARKPLDGTVASNVLAHGVGGLNIDACRVQTDDDTSRPPGKIGGNTTWDLSSRREPSVSHAAGRFPANVLLDEHAAKEMDEQSGVLKSGGVHKGGGATSSWFTFNKSDVDYAHYPDSGGASRFFPVFKSEEETPETKGRFPANVLLDEHAAAEMDEQSGVLKTGAWNGKRSTPKTDAVYGYREGGNENGRPADSGGASRFFPVFKYQAKAPKKERPVIEREDGSKIQHPTVKPEKLMSWLVELITPPGGVVLDPFAGSGTTLQAAINKGFTPIGIEQDADYIKLIEQRLGLLDSQ